MTVALALGQIPTVAKTLTLTRVLALTRMLTLSRVLLMVILVIGILCVLALPGRLLHLLKCLVGCGIYIFWAEPE